MFKNKNAIAAAAVSMGMLSACVRQDPNTVGIELEDWGKDVSVSTEAGLKCLLPCLPGHEYLFLSTGEFPVNVIARLPDNKDSERTLSQENVAAYGVIKTGEGLPLQGPVTFLVQFNLSDRNKDEVENLYKKYPKLNGENDTKWFNRIQTRLAQFALEDVQTVYGSYSVADVLEKRDEISETLKGAVQQRFDEAGLSFVSLNSVILGGINLGPAAEQLNQRIGQANASVAVAEEQKEAADDVAATAAEQAKVIGAIVRELESAGLEGAELDNGICITLKTMNIGNFPDNHPQGCFGSSDLEAAISQGPSRF